MIYIRTLYKILAFARMTYSSEVTFIIYWSMKYIRTIVVLVIVLSLDLMTKYFFYDKAIGSKVLLLSPHFNTGIAWSLPVPLWLVLVLTILVLWTFTFLYYKKQLLRRVFALLTAGAIGNMYDRAVLWWVRDFVDLWWFPVFNIADIAITVAAIAIIFSLVFPWKFIVKK